MIDPLDNNVPPVRHIQSPETVEVIIDALLDIAEPEQQPTVAIYPNSFTDQTGARLSNSQFASFSTAITQAPQVFLIRALKRAAHGNFFKVTERIGLDNLTKERQLIRNTRAQFEEENALMPLIFSGMLAQGAVVAYENNSLSGGAGARLLGVGTSRQYREDTVTVSVRLVSVSTGEVLLETLVRKSVLSASITQDLFRFFTTGSELTEIEVGRVANESVHLALQAAVETAVLNLIEDGAKKAFWRLKE